MKLKKKNIAAIDELQIPAIWKNVLLGIALIFIALFFAHKILFVNADLGRHIKNGEIISSILFGNGIKVKEIPGSVNLFTANYYSYTEPAFPLINHHWGSGLIFYFIWKFFGFNGLAFFHVLINTATCLLFFKIAQKKSNFIAAFFFLIISIPLITSRTEIRPEAFSYFFCGLYYYFLILFSEGKISFRKTFILLIPIQFFWVNLHIFFVLGIFLTGIFWVESVIKKKPDLKSFSILLLAQVAICFLNPNGFYGFVELFMIFREYGYMIAENQSLFFMQNRFPESFLYYHFEILFILALSAFIYLIKKKPEFSFNPHFFILLFFTVLSFKMIRAIPLWGLFFIPFCSATIDSLKQKVIFFNSRKTLSIFFLFVSSAILFFGFFTKNHYYSPINGINGLGLFEKINSSADFIKSKKVEGPIFNNYDIGGFMIFNLFPQYKVFVDNRPEAYSVDFFKKIYEPMQENENKWRELSLKYDFNAIYFYRHDNTPNAQPFLIRRVNDEDWAPVFVDDFTIIFLKRNEKNNNLIKKFELPKSLFISVPQ